MDIDYKELDLYLRASTNLYGHLEPKSFISVYKQYTGTRITKADLLAYAQSVRDKELGYSVYPDAIVKDGLTLEKIEEIHTLQEDRPLYLPSKADFLNWANDGYYEPNAFTIKFITAVKARGLSDDNAEALTKTLYKGIMRDEDFAVDYDLMDSYGVFLGLNDEEIDEFLFSYYIPLSNSVKRFANMGFSANELTLVLCALKTENPQ